jgi:hypothetical protein
VELENGWYDRGCYVIVIGEAQVFMVDIKKQFCDVIKYAHIFDVCVVKYSDPLCVNTNTNTNNNNTTA